MTCSEITTSMDLLPTFARLADTDAPSDRVIDGKDIRSLMFGEEDATSPRDAFFYYFRDNIDAVRSGKWKLHVRKGDKIAKFWVEPEVTLVDSYGMTSAELTKLGRLVAAHRDLIERRWHEYFSNEA